MSGNYVDAENKVKPNRKKKKRKKISALMIFFERVGVGEVSFLIKLKLKPSRLR